MRRLLAVLRHPVTRGVFVVIAVAAATVAIVHQREQIADAMRQLPLTVLLVAAALTPVHLWCTMLSWRAVMADLGSPLSAREAVGVFGPSQLGKYVPGGVWNVVAAGELAADLRIPRRRTFSAMLVAMLLSVVTGVTLGLPLLLTGAGVAQPAWLLLAAPVLAVLVAPPVLNRLLGYTMRVLRRAPLDGALSTAGTVRATTWALLGWMIVGAQVWVLGLGLGMQAAVDTLAASVAAYALAWVVGFVAVVAPAGLGAREVVLAALLGDRLDAGAVIVVVLAVRVLQTLGDLAFAALGVVWAREARRRGQPQDVADGTG